MTACDASAGIEYFQSLLPDSIYCTDSDVENEVQIYSDKLYFRRLKREVEAGEGLQAAPEIVATEGLPCVTVSFLNRNGTLPERSGLNWGQRPEEGREPNQAYISLKADVYQTDFFPPRKVHFTVLTDDGKVLICTGAQDNGKAVHTPHNNSLIGEYFRNRLGISSGELVTKAHLDRYGRHDVVFCKMDDETYTMDFSV